MRAARITAGPRPDTAAARDRPAGRAAHGHRAAASSGHILAPDDVDLAVVGGGLLTNELRRLSSELGIDGRVLSLGQVAEEELPDWYRAADLFVLPTVAYEGFGMVTVEALASGTPVVGTPAGRRPSCSSRSTHASSLEGSDPDSLAVAIRDALWISSTTTSENVVATYAVARFNWDKVAAAWETGACAS